MILGIQKHDVSILIKLLKEVKISYEEECNDPLYEDKEETKRLLALTNDLLAQTTLGVH